MMAVRTTERREPYHRPELDALRFFAFLSVFLFHGLAFYSLGTFRHFGDVPSRLSWAMGRSSFLFSQRVPDC